MSKSLKPSEYIAPQSREIFQTFFFLLKGLASPPYDQKYFWPSRFPEFHSNSQVNNNWSIRKVTVKALILWERYRHTLFAS